MHQLTIHAGHVRAVGYSPDGRRLVSAGNDRTVRLIEVATGKVLRYWDGLRRILSLRDLFALREPHRRRRRASPTTPPPAASSSALARYPRIRSPGRSNWPSHSGMATSEPMTASSAMGYSADGKLFFAATGNKRTARAEGDVRVWRCRRSENGPGPHGHRPRLRLVRRLLPRRHHAGPRDRPRLAFLHGDALEPGRGPDAGAGHEIPGVVPRRTHPRRRLGALRSSSSTSRRTPSAPR